MMPFARDEPRLNAVSDLAVGLIIGCARSGTSILGEAVAAHPDVTYIFEAHQIWEKGGEGPNGCHRLISASATPAVKAEILEWFARQSEAGRILVEKCPRNTLPGALHPPHFPRSQDSPYRP